MISRQERDRSRAKSDGVVMARFGKPDATGRSSGKLSGRERKLRSPPKGKAWNWHTGEMLESDAWRALSLRGRRLIDFLELEYMANAGRCNGELMATYDQLANFGIVRRFILETIEEVKRNGFIVVEHGGRWNMTNRPSLYRLTYYADKDGNPATNDWRRFTKANNRIDLQKVILR